jgi:protoporphyrinogen oxidase
MRFARASVGHYYNDKLYSLGGPRDVLTTELLSLPNRLRFLVVSAYLKSGINKIFEGQTAMQGCKRFYGEEITERIWKPLLEGKFSDYQDFVPMSWLASRVRDRSMRLGYMEGSFDLFYNALFKACALNNVKSNYSYRVHSIRVGVDKVLVDDHAYDACLSTVGPVVEQNLGIDCVNSEFMYLGAICVVYELDENPQIPYWTNYCDPTSPVMAVINHRELDSSYRLGKCYPVYSAAYLTPGSQLYSLTDHDLIQLFFVPVQNIGRLAANSSSLRFNCATVYRSRYAQPLINPGIKLPPIVSFEGPLYRASMHSIYPNDRGQNYAVALGKRMALKMAADLAS